MNSAEYAAYDKEFVVQKTSDDSANSEISTSSSLKTSTATRESNYYEKPPWWTKKVCFIA